jgi:DNA-binding response OmpR family regulator
MVDTRNEWTTQARPDWKTPKQVLIVDDEPEVLRAASLWLGAAGYKTMCARDGEQAVVCAVRFGPDAVILDVRMPRVDGLTTLSELKLRDDTKHIPVIMLSASLIDQQKALDAGASFFLTKPYKGKTLVAAVDAVVRRAEESSQIGNEVGRA